MANQLEEEVKSLSKEFAKKLGFLDVSSMRDTAYQFKEMFGDDCSDNNTDEIISPSQEIKRKSMCTANLVPVGKDNDCTHEERKSRKSRKSVCVLPKIIMSSSSEEDSEDDEQNVTSDGTEEEIEEEKLNHRGKRNRNHLDSSTDEEEEVEKKQNDKASFLVDKTRKKINYISSSDEEEGEKDEENAAGDIAMLSQSLKKQTLHDEQSDGSDFEDYIPSAKNTEKQKHSVEYNSADDSEGSLKEFIVSDNERKSESESEEDDDEVVFQTPIPKPKQQRILKEKQVQRFVTPHSQSRKILNLCTPKSVPGTPAYKREFNRKRDQTISELFQLFNKTVFGAELPADLQITWNKRMTKTAGFCYYSKSLGVPKCRIELSDKVIDSTERVRDTLIHELCHAATWLINGVQAGHGPSWKHWAQKANKIHPDLPIIARCHQYEIHTKYTYCCNGCGATFGRHSKSINPSKQRCAACGGIPELQNNKSSASATPKTPNAYALFVKDNFATIKKSNPGKSHRDIMVLISDKFKLSKDLKNKENL